MRKKKTEAMVRSKPVLTLIENDLDDFWKKMEHRERMMREKLIKAEVSPIHYYMGY